MKLPIHPRKMAFLLPCLLVLAFLTLVFWPQSPPDAETLANRGKTAPLKSSFGSFGPGIGWDWFDQGFDAFMEWDKNPWKRDRTGFSTHLETLRTSKDPKDQAEYQRLLDLAKKWHENLLARYPELRVTYRNIPDEDNALKQLLELHKKRIADKGTGDFCFPPEIRSQLQGSMPWDAVPARAWLEANRDLMDEIHRISRLTGSSTEGMGGDNFMPMFECTTALMIEARVAAESGDAQAALDAVKSATALSRFLLETDAPSLMQALIGKALHSQTRNCVLQGILPALPGQDPAVWAAALQPKLQTPADFANVVKGEWNSAMQYYLLPALVDPSEPRSPADADLFVESYTRYVADQVKQFESRSAGELSSQPWKRFDASDLSWRSQQLGEDSNNIDFPAHWIQQNVRAGLTQAAFDILQGKPVPNDPIFGLPYQWNPETRELSIPKVPELSKMGKLWIKLPKL